MHSFVSSRKQHGDLYELLCSQLTGGLSYIFCRLAISGETKIRSHKIENPETVKKVLGLDANSLYLHAIAQNNPTGYFFTTKKKKIFGLILVLNLVFNHTNS